MESETDLASVPADYTTTTRMMRQSLPLTVSEHGEEIEAAAAGHSLLAWKRAVVRQQSGQKRSNKTGAAVKPQESVVRYG